MKNGPSSLDRDFGHLRPGDPGRVALVAPPGEASLVARRLDPAWSVEEMWERREVALGLRRCDLILFAPGGPGPSPKVPGDVAAVTGLVATARGTPTVLRLPGRDNPWLEEISSRLHAGGIAVSGEDARLAEVVQDVALEPFMSATAALMRQEIFDVALRKAVSEVVALTPPPDGQAGAMTGEGLDPFPWRVQELARRGACSLGHIKGRARSRGMKPGWFLQVNRAFHGLARYRAAGGRRRGTEFSRAAWATGARIR